MSKTIFFSVLRSSVWSKIKGGLGPPGWTPPLDPPLNRWGIKQLGISFDSIFLLFSCQSSRGATFIIFMGNPRPPAPNDSPGCPSSTRGIHSCPCYVSIALMYVHQVILGEEGVILLSASRNLQGKLFIVGWGFYDIHTNS